MGAHVWFPAYLRDHLLPSWRVAGWSPDWFAGFPAGQFYFPVPALLVVVLDVVLPYNVAFKLVTALGPVALPAGAYVLGRGLKVRRPGPELFAVAATLFLFFKGVDGRRGHARRDDPVQPADHGRPDRQRARGGVLVHARARVRPRRSSARSRSRCGRAGGCGSPRVLLAATVLCHLVVGIFVARRRAGRLAVPPPDADVPRSRSRSARSARCSPRSGRSRCSRRSATRRTCGTRSSTWYLDYLFPAELWWVVRARGDRRGRRRGAPRSGGARASLSDRPIAFALVFRLWPELHAWNLRFLPFWYLGLFLLAASRRRRDGARDRRSRSGSCGSARRPLARGAAGRSTRSPTARRFRLVKSVRRARADRPARGRRPRRATLQPTAGSSRSGPSGTTRATRTAPRRATKPKPYGEYRDLMDTMGRLPPGRAMWEGGQAIDTYGTSLALMLLPYWTDGRITSMEGLYYESAATTPFHFMAVAPLSGPGQRVEPGARPRLPHDRRLRPRRPLPAAPRRPLLHGVLARRRRTTRTRTRTSSWSRRSPTATASTPKGWNIYEVRGRRDGRAADATSRSSCHDPHGGHAGRVLRPPARSRGSRPAELGPWECLAAGWWNDPDALDRPLAAGGPVELGAGVPAPSADGAPRQQLPPGSRSPTCADRRLGVVRGVADRRAGRRADVVLPELGGERAPRDRGGSRRTSWSWCRPRVR